ncbi:hypothetical protein [Salinibacter phage M31CR41-2]|uniref:Uncharacterized protein n=2 Tax=Kairosalinivirus TaxID=2560158 RepID=A0A2I6UH74_9CAUD|nr:hypothetical protein FGG68_gp69 [Salinibacter phage M31CR41-2]YP_009639629.1 hypothetical protein FGG69_gp17 [Salinibacter phage SRUTV-1]ATU47054.1 hypothetical protein [Salinibacter phage SRUTV-1]AUO79325.1 hypothetical protein [Salinibacter phage M31CR41-2]
MKTRGRRQTARSIRSDRRGLGRIRLRRFEPKVPQPSVGRDRFDSAAMIIANFDVDAMAEDVAADLPVEGVRA